MVKKIIKNKRTESEICCIVLFLSKYQHESNILQFKTILPTVHNSFWCIFFLPLRHNICQNGHQGMNRTVWNLVDLFPCNFLDISFLAKKFYNLVNIQLGYLLVRLELLLYYINFFLMCDTMNTHYHSRVTSFTFVYWSYLNRPCFIRIKANQNRHGSSEYRPIGMTPTIWLYQKYFQPD